MILIANTCFTQLLAAINSLSMSIFTLQNDLQHSQYYDSFCLFRGYFSPGSCAMIIYSFILRGIHRYTSAVYPSRLFWQSQRTQIILICATWIFCLLFPSIYGQMLSEQDMKSNIIEAYEVLKEIIRVRLFLFCTQTSLRVRVWVW